MHMYILFKKYKIYTKILKNALTCFDHTIILREHTYFYLQTCCHSTMVT